jgi:hypothetical protein
MITILRTDCTEFYEQQKCLLGHGKENEDIICFGNHQPHRTFISLRFSLREAVSVLLTLKQCEDENLFYVLIVLESVKVNRNLR